MPQRVSVNKAQCYSLLLSVCAFYLSPFLFLLSPLLSSPLSSPYSFPLSSTPSPYFSPLSSPLPSPLSPLLSPLSSPLPSPLLSPLSSSLLPLLTSLPCPLPILPLYSLSTVMLHMQTRRQTPQVAWQQQFRKTQHQKMTRKRCSGRSFPHYTCLVLLRCHPQPVTIQNVGCSMRSYALALRCYLVP